MELPHKLPPRGVHLGDQRLQLLHLSRARVRQPAGLRKVLDKLGHLGVGCRQVFLHVAGLGLIRLQLSTQLLNLHALVVQLRPDLTLVLPQDLEPFLQFIQLLGLYLDLVGLCGKLPLGRSHAQVVLVKVRLGVRRIFPGLARGLLPAHAFLLGCCEVRLKPVSLHVETLNRPVDVGRLLLEAPQLGQQHLLLAVARVQLLQRLVPLADELLQRHRTLLQALFGGSSAPSLSLPGSLGSVKGGPEAIDLGLQVFRSMHLQGLFVSARLIEHAPHRGKLFLQSIRLGHFSVEPLDLEFEGRGLLGRPRRGVRGERRRNWRFVPLPSGGSLEGCELALHPLALLL